MSNVQSPLRETTLEYWTLGFHRASFAGKTLDFGLSTLDFVSLDFGLCFVKTPKRQPGGVGLPSWFLTPVGERALASRCAGRTSFSEVMPILRQFRRWRPDARSLLLKQAVRFPERVLPEIPSVDVRSDPRHSKPPPKSSAPRSDGRPCVPATSL